MADGTPPRRATFGERLQRTRQKRNEDWWSIILGGPVAQVLAALIADVRWITPNGVTWIAFALKLACVPLLLAGTRTADLLVVLFMQVNVVLDCLDGILARYRKAGSATGAFLDKITDAVGLFALIGAFAVRIHGADPWGALVLASGCALWCVRIYAYWVVAFLEKEKGAPKPTITADVRKPFGELGFVERLGYYATSMWRIVLLAEADVYFWLGLALLTGWERPIAWVVGVGLAAWSIGILVYRYVTVIRLDAWLRSSAP